MTIEPGNPETPVASRRERRTSTAQKAVSRPLTASAAHRRFLLPLAVTGLIAATVGLGGGYLWGSNADNNDWKTEVSSNPVFAALELPEGWTAEQAAADVGTRFSDRNPIPASSGSCTFTRNTVYVEAGAAGLGAEYLSKDLLYESVLPLMAPGASMGEGLTVDTDKVLLVDDEKTESVFAQWEGGRALVRVFDREPAEVPEDMASAGPGAIPTVLDRGIPAVVVSHTCVNHVELDDEVSEALFDAVKVSSGL